jgi:hypothetical protein
MFTTNFFDFFASRRSDMKTITAIAAIALAGLSINASAAVNNTGRVDSSTNAGIERPAEVKYQTGRVDQGSTQGIYSHDGRLVTNGRQG